MMISSSPLVPTSVVGASPAAAATPASAVTAFTLTLQSMAPGGESALAAPLLTTGLAADAAPTQVLGLTIAMPPSEAATRLTPLPSSVIPTVTTDAEPAAPKLAALAGATAQIAPVPAAPASAVTVETLVPAAQPAVANPDPEAFARPVAETEATPLANPIENPRLAERAPAAPKSEPAVEAGRGKIKATEPGKAERRAEAPAIASNGEPLVIKQAEPAIVLAAVAAEPAPAGVELPTELAALDAVAAEPAPAGVELPTELAALDAEALPVESPIAPAAALLAQPEVQRQAASGAAKAAADTAPPSPRLAAAPTVTESNAFASPIPTATAAATGASAAAADAAVFSIALDGQLPQAANDTQGLPSSLFGQTLAPAASRPLSAQHIYPTQPAPLPGTVTAQPGRIGREMGVEIARRVSGGQDEMLIRLNPQEMGRIEVRLTFDESGAVRAVLASESPAALEMLRRDTGDLARSLADAGVRSDSQSFRFDRTGGDGAGQRGHGGGNSQHGRDGHGSAFQGGADEEPDASAYRQLRSSGQVNLIA